jgi:hypothetical protein
MVLADSGRIARVPPYLGTPLGQDPVSATGLSPSMARLSRRLAYQIPVLNAVPQPRRSFLRRFGLFRFRSPLLAESSFLSFPRGTKMFHFPRFARTRLCIQRAVRRHYPPWVSPFGNLRIKAWLAAPRSLSQLPASFIASCRLGIHRVPFLAWSSSLPAPLSRCGRRRRPRSSPVAHPWVNKGRSRHTLCLLFLRICSCQRTGPAGTWFRRSSADRIRYGGLEGDSLQLAPSVEWSRSGSNRRHPACKAGALPAELRPPSHRGAGFTVPPHPRRPRPGTHETRLRPPKALGFAVWAWIDLNYRPHAYQACALTN